MDTKLTTRGLSVGIGMEFPMSDGNLDYDVIQSKFDKANIYISELQFLVI